jgi:hypothetical protein
MSANAIIQQIASLQMQLAQLANQVQAGAARAPARPPIEASITGLPAPGPGPQIGLPTVNGRGCTSTSPCGGSVTCNKAHNTCGHTEDGSAYCEGKNIFGKTVQYNVSSCL